MAKAGARPDRRATRPVRTLATERAPAKISAPTPKRRRGGRGRDFRRRALRGGRSARQLDRAPALTVRAPLLGLGC